MTRAVSPPIRSRGARQDHKGPSGTRARRRDHVLAAASVFTVFVGVVKGTFLLSWVPFDPSVVVAAALAGVLGWRLLVGGAQFRICFPAVVLVLLLVPPTLARPEAGYHDAKVQALLLTLTIVITSVYLLGTELRIRLWIVYLAGAGILTAVLLLVLPSDPAHWGRAVFEGSNTIATGRMTGLSVVVFAVFAMLPGRKRHRILAIAATAFAGTEMLATGSRGPLLGAVIALVVVALRLQTGSGTAARILRLLLLAALFVSTWLFISTSSSAGSARIEQSLTGQISSTGTRDPLWEASWRYLGAWPDALWGTGWGGFQEVLRAGELLPASRQYPHNVFLEVFIEGGLLTAVAISAFIVVSTLRILRAANSPTGIAMLGLVAFGLVNACVSGDLNDNRIFWTCLALSWMIPLRGGGRRRALPA